MKKLLLCAFMLLGYATASALPVMNGATPSTSQPDDSPPVVQDHTQIMNVVADFVRQQTASLPGNASYRIENIDQRIRLSACSRIEAFQPAGSQLIGKTSVGVRCMKENGWSIFVPVHVRIRLDLLISARQLPSGHTLRNEDITSQTVEASRIEGLTDSRQALGQVLRYGIAAGQVLREGMLRPPYSVTQGQVVQLAVQGNGFSIHGEGVAMNNAGEGQAVRVRVGSGRVIGGIARTSGVVEIDS